MLISNYLIISNQLIVNLWLTTRSDHEPPLQLILSNASAPGLAPHAAAMLCLQDSHLPCCQDHLLTSPGMRGDGPAEHGFPWRMRKGSCLAGARPDLRAAADDFSKSLDGSQALPRCGASSKRHIAAAMSRRCTSGGAGHAKGQGEESRRDFWRVALLQQEVEIKLLRSTSCDTATLVDVPN